MLTMVFDLWGQPNGIRGYVVIPILLLAFGFSLAMVYDASLRRKADEIVRSCSLALFCLYALLGTIAFRRQPPNWRTPIVVAAAILAIIGFTMARRSNRASRT